jgi:predicted nucleotidyltransferase
LYLNMIQLYQKVTQLKVLKHFFDEPTERFYLRELARLLRMSPMTLKRALDLLVRDGLITREKTKNQIFYQANTESHAYRYEKIAYNLAQLEKKAVVEYILENVPGVSSIVLYGSYAKGENDKHSDIDLLIISTAKKVILGDIEEKFKVELNVMNFSSAQWTEQARSNKAFYLDVITEGIPLYGTKPVI